MSHSEFLQELWDAWEDEVKRARSAGLEAKIKELTPDPNAAGFTIILNTRKLADARRISEILIPQKRLL